MAMLLKPLCLDLDFDIFDITTDFVPYPKKKSRIIKYVPKYSLSPHCKKIDENWLY